MYDAFIPFTFINGVPRCFFVSNTFFDGHMSGNSYTYKPVEMCFII